MQLVTIATARIQRMGKVMFSLCPHLGGSVQPGGSGQSSQGGVRSVQPGGWVSPAGGSGQSSQGEGVSPAGGGGSGQSSQGGSGQSSWEGVGQSAGGSGQSSRGGQVSLGGSVSWGGQVSPARGRGQVSPAGGWVSQPGGSAKIGQQNEYSLHGGRYASCIHAGGLSCFKKST